MNSRYLTAGCAVALTLTCLQATAQAQSQSLYDEKKFQSLTADRKAHRPGDILTVQLIETASASANVDSDSRRSNTVDASLGHTQGTTARTALAADNRFDGGGSTQRTGKLLGVISVTVGEVLPNGDLVVTGVQTLDINDEKQRISLNGRVRAVDVSDTNTVSSTRIADAKITYSGDGELAERQRPSWWSRLLRTVGL